MTMTYDPARFTAALDGMMDAFIAVDPEWRVTYANAGAETLLGAEAETLAGRLFWDLVNEPAPAPEGAAAPEAAPHPEAGSDPDIAGGARLAPSQRPEEDANSESNAGAPNWKAVLAAALAEGRAAEVEAYIEALDGWVEMRASPFEGGLCFFCRDITERRVGRSALRESERLSHAIVTSVGEGVIVYDRELRYRAWNPFMEQLTGLPAERVLGHVATDVFPHLRESGADRLIERALEGQTVRTPDTRYYVPDTGREGWVISLYSPHMTTEGEIIGVVGIVHDITARKKAEEALAESERFLRSTVDALSAHIGILDASGTVLAVNAAWKEFGRSNGAVPGDRCDVGKNYLESCDEARGRGADAAVRIAGGTRGVLEGRHDEFYYEYECTAAGERRWFTVRVTRFDEEDPLRAVVAHEDITQRKLAEERLVHDAFHDALTGLPNRALFMDRLDRQLKRAKRKDSDRFAVLFLDLDRFKLVNDTRGHTRGDELLVDVAQRIHECLREEDTVARFGGDEFAILLVDLDAAGEATRIAQRMNDALIRPFVLEGTEIFTSASIGIALSTRDYETPGEMLRDADTAMYRAKARGRGLHEVFDSEMHAELVQLLELETDLRRAIDADELVLHFQPIVALDTGDIKALEALLRWQHPARGLVPPMTFLPVAEDTGLIVPIGRWVLETACRQMREWREAFPEMDSLTVNVNLSARQLTQPDLVVMVETVLEETGLEARHLNLEITESVIMHRTDAAADALADLQRRGVKVSIDDFGTGYSSLSYLHRFPINVLKVDRSFISGANAGRDRMEIVETIVTLARNLEMDVVAEGVETDAQRAALERMGCRQAQGFIFARPVASAEIRELLEEASS